MIIEDRLYDVGELPVLGNIPRNMYAYVLRNERLGSTDQAFVEEVVKTPLPGDGEVLIATKAAGVNYNGIWAAKGTPFNVVQNNGNYGYPKEDFHICGSECSGIVYAVGEGVKNVKIGDEVCVNAIQYNPNCPVIRKGCPPEYSPTYHIWGYEGNWGAFAQFCRVNDHQCIKKPKSLSWETAGACVLTGSTIYRMLYGWKGNQLKEGDIVLIWGGAGGLGSIAIQLVRAKGGIPIAVVSSETKGQDCMSIGAKGYINRNNYLHWGSISNLDDTEYKKWLISATKFRNEIYKIAGKREAPAIVIEHPGADSLPTSIFVCGSGGMVVLCGATTGYIGSLDLRFLWMYQKRLQGSHYCNKEECDLFMSTLVEEKIEPVIHKVYQWKDLPKAHMDMEKGSGITGKLVIQIKK